MNSRLWLKLGQIYLSFIALLFTCSCRTAVLLIPRVCTRAIYAGFLASYPGETLSRPPPSARYWVVRRRATKSQSPTEPLRGGIQFYQFPTLTYLCLPHVQVLVSPVLAGLAVGIGVPILLFYVYGVVPVSLCRSGGCGVSTSSAGVRFDFDDENDLLGVLGTRNTGESRTAWTRVSHTLARASSYIDAVSMDAVSHRGGNPSIGEVSLSLGSGSQLERLGRENDRESASNVALAGASIAGSITSSLVPGGQRLEVQADVASTQRFSMSSETASAATSLSEKSVSVSMADDRGASTRALAGSVLNFKVDCSSAEVHADCASQRSDDAGGPVSLSSLEELASVGHSRRSRRRTPFERQASDSSSWTAGGEDGGSERVRFDDHVSFIETSSGRWRGQSPCDLGPQREYLALDDDIENKSTSSLRSVFFHSSTTEGGKRLPKIRKSGGAGDGNVGSTDVEQQSSARQTPTLPVIPEPSADHSVKIEIPSEDN
uniref:Uncharacterized protein n=1 Tax=Timema genevievae TaxID=629358 RepID=A0A7R9JST2_TIMGE|nr:unnamed protein product [Timema genevievae]